ncbi:MFS general substrate transporter [Corynespora cassiicola Philippines]|uniref:MFS general substrate transporter n=1 Tax=Corynespora cassiicola Philippines TaxID=1448308 RepID=A0A2T2N7Y7_CORCC|nr:MFS general substrate transporter [Corynespora cassiicola Philippines]
MSGFRYAFSLSKDEVRIATPPGTVILIDHRETPSDFSAGVLRLVPRPSINPADPLNLPRWRKIAILFCMSLFAFLANFSSSSISSALPAYASSPVLGTPPQSLSELNKLVAVHVLMLGASNIFWVPLSNSFGRRPVVLLSLSIMIAASLWAKLATSFESLLAARAVMGIGGGPADAVSPDVVGEIFFVHERGRAMAVYNTLLCLGSVVGGISGGYLAALGFEWIHWINVIFSAVNLTMCFFFQSETLYERDYSSSTPSTTSDSEKAGIQQSTVVGLQTVDYPSFTYLKSLKIGTYRPGLVQNFKNVLLTLRLPGVWLVSFWYAGLVGAMVAMTSSGPTFVSQAPYFWGGLVGSALGGLYTYSLVDWTTRYYAKKDKDGISEPEPRLAIGIPSLIIATAGTLIFGFVGQNPSSKGWLGLEFGVGMVAFGLMQAPSVGFNYIIESYPKLPGDCFVAITTVRSLISFAWTFFAGSWVEDRGAAEPYGIFAMVQGLIVVFTRLRIATTDLTS